jgi:hypothetical protein
MNERIKELMNQTGIPTSIPFDQWCEKFAELIVKECIDIVKPTGDHEVWAQSYLGGVEGLDLLYSKIKDIKRHFGVEE